MKLQPCAKVGYGRCVTPEETVQRLEAIIADRYDYWCVDEKVSDHLYWSALFIDRMDFRSMGKGISPVLSKAGALAEGAEWLTSRPTDALPGYLAAHQSDVPDALPVEELLAHVKSVTAGALARIKSLDAAQHWVDGVSLISNRRLKIPIEYVRHITGPNGKAAGNRLEEAIVHAVNEVFERRAHITVLKNRMVVPTIDADTITHPVIKAQLAFVRSKGIKVTLKDLSFGGVLPCVGAYFRDPNIPEAYQFHHFFKVGSSFDREDALIRTFTEYVQGRRTDEFIAADKAEQDRVLNYDFRNLKCLGDDGDNYMSCFMFGFVPYHQADFLLEGEVVPFERGPCYNDCLQDIDAAKAICQRLDKDFIVVDYTDPVIGFPVVQVVIPGYSDVLPFYPASSTVLFEEWTRSDVLKSYDTVSAT